MLSGLRSSRRVSASWRLCTTRAPLSLGLLGDQSCRGLAARPHRKHKKGAVVDLDLGSPHTWFPEARNMKRRIICHVGPTNSGKTHEALERLQQARTGIYCGPLRLLAWEIYEKLNGRAMPCNLWTGQEVKEVDKARHVSCTVEMADVSSSYEVAVVDECQLLADRERGWAWTRAILGLPAIELHLCGSPAFVELVQQLAEKTGDDVEVREYERLSPLRPDSKPIKDWDEVQPGDCVVAFSRKKLFQLKNEIETAVKGKLRCCIVYGGLPPDARQKQARLFNDASSGYDVLVASDAIGMGLNLSIGRVVFSTLTKFDGEDDRSLTGPEIRQIAGRAGRYLGQYEEGRVSARKKGDLNHIGSALGRADEPLLSAGLKATREQLKLFAKARGLKIRETVEDCLEYMEQRKQRKRKQSKGDEEGSKEYTDFAVLLDLFVTSVKLEDQEGMYFMCDIQDMKAIARILEDLPLSLSERYTFCIAPVDSSSDQLMSHLNWFARQFVDQGIVHAGVDLEDERVPTTPNQIKQLEDAHAILDAYLWLAVRFGEKTFVDYKEAAATAELCSNLIEQGLRKLKPPPPPKPRASSGGGGRRLRGGRHLRW